MTRRPVRLYKWPSLLDRTAQITDVNHSHVKCLSCGERFVPNSARQTHYCSAACGDRTRNNRKRRRRLALRRNIEILDSLRVPVGYSQVVNLDDLCKQGFDPEVYTDRMDFLLTDGITRSCRIYIERYLIQNDQKNITIQYL